MLRLLVGLRFHVLFHSPPGVLFTFPSRYWFTIGHRVVFSLTGWSRLIHTEFLVYRATQDTASSIQPSTTGLSPSLACLSNTSSNLLDTFSSPTTPTGLAHRFGLLPLRSPLLRESLLFSFPSATKMFQFTEFALPILWIQMVVIGLPHSETPGSSFASNSPGRIAGNRVLLRLPVPRYPP